MMANKYLLLILVVWICTVAAYTGDDLPPGPYCGGSGVNGGDQCCENRQDGCSHQIKDTRCYCDDFCNRPNSHDDCCPDYIDVCHKDWAPPPAPFVKKECYLHGKKYLEGKSAMIDCNMRTCIYDERENITKWADDEKDECIISKGVINGVRNRLTWRATNYTEFASKKLKDGLIKKLGTLPLSPSITRLVPIRYDKDIDYPANFDARTRWPGYISPVIDQGWCGSDWAVALAGVTSDRFAIQSNGAENMILSPQTLLSCNERNQKGCDGGHVDVAWNFARNYGLMPENCFPYTAKKTKCPFTESSSLQQHKCHPSYEARTSKYKVGPVGRLEKEQDIMYDILHGGPVFAVMTVYQDFFHYRDGIYRHSQFGDNQMKGLHSVRIVGWGEGSGDKYWLVANSWGQEWGENGYFRIARGSDESGIESFVLTALSEVEVSQKK